MGRTYTNKNQVLVSRMIEIYKPIDIDWMSYKITRNNTLTFHHIKSECSGGLTVIENGALITKRAHQILNKIALLDIMLYDDWNLLFRLINDSKTHPSREYIEESKILKKCSESLIYR